jgi:hypothetical protein
MSANPAAASALAIRMTGNSGPSPPPLAEPIRVLNTLVAGDDALPVETAETDDAGDPAAPVEAAETDDAGPGPRRRDNERELWGAVASGRAAAATPAGPCSARACRVEAVIAPPPPPLADPAFPDVPPGPPGRPTAPAVGWTVFVGWPPPAVGTVSTYWPTLAFPGGAMV